ncbi:MAG: DUF4435 domain-containing protein [Planctomycetota bacterium]
MRQYIDSDDLASDVRMTRSLDFRAVVIVEGDIDARFFERFVDHESCYVLAAHDRSRALGVLRVLNASHFSGVLTIVDADFGRITGTLETDANLLFCDGHDLEIMLIRSQALERVVAEHASADKLSSYLAACKPVVLATFLAQACLPLGAFILISLQQNLGLTFEDLPFKEFVDQKSLAIDLPKLIRTVMNKSSRHDPQLARQLDQEITAQMNKVAEIWDMARGHDCIELLSFALRSAIGTKKSKTADRTPLPFNSQVLERELRLCFSEMDFAATMLFRGISTWESANSDHRVTLKLGAGG